MKYLVLFAVLCCFSAGHAQQFPASFVGHWEGTLLWFQSGKKDPQKVKMQLVIRPADTAGQYTWQLIYGDKNKDNRPYLLKPVDTAVGHWIIDERNGILLDQYWIGRRFTSVFTVQHASILNSYWIEGGRLMVEFFSYRSQASNRSGQGTEDVPFVDSYTIRNYQKAELRKKR